MRIVDQLVAALLPVLNLMDAAAGILVQRNVEPVDQLRIPVLDEPRRVFAVVLGGLGDVVAEPAHQLQAHHVAVLFLVLLQRALFELRIQIPAVLRDLQKPRLMVDARDLPLHSVIVLHAQHLHQMAGAHLHAVAQAHRLDGGVALHIAGQHGHGIGIVEEQRVRANRSHIIGKILHHGDGAQSTEDTADAQRIADGLAQAVLLGHFKVRYRAGLVQAHLNGVNHIGCAAQRFTAVFHAQIGGDHRMAAHIAVERRQHPAAIVQTNGIDIIQGKFAVLQHGRQHAVAHYIFDKNTGARSHKDDFSHKSVPPTRRNICAITFALYGQNPAFRNIYMLHIHFLNVASFSVVSAG